jgi:DNA invertase Pin-like site-specific DNA recombinase
MAAGIYCRISSDRAGEGLGVARQEELCRKLAADRGWPVANVYVDNDRSAYNRKRRPEYERMLADIEAGLIDAVICVDLDRLTRRPAELESFIDLANIHDVALANVSGDTDLSTSEGRTMARVVGAFARQESEKRSERLQREAEQAARAGKPRGSNRPFGYEKDRVTIRAEEADLIRAATERILDGASVSSVAREWNAREVPTVQNAKHGWTSTSVAGVLRNPRVAGLRAYKGEVVADGKWEPILDRATFERLEAKIRRTARKGRPAKQLLSAIARCGNCGTPMWTSHKNESGRRVARYTCLKRPGAPGCGKIGVVAEPLDQLITDAVIHRLETPAMTRALTRKPKPPKVDLDLAQIERDLEGLATDFGTGDISRREWLAARKPLEDRAVRARQAVDTANGTSALVPFRTGDVRVVWDKLDVDRKRVVLDVLIDRIIVNPAARPGQRFQPDRVDVIWKA